MQGDHVAHVARSVRAQDKGLVSVAVWRQQPANAIHGRHQAHLIGLGKRRQQFSVRAAGKLIQGGEFEPPGITKTENTLAPVFGAGTLVNKPFVA